ncbi:hypothetical protein [Streptomyces hundungensis]|uniref:hypothetical protein n=1 Tax=Streptomyces hundungensis TaxID=1077946 RepID=UPI0033CE43EB
MDPVVAGAVVTVCASVVSGVVKIVHSRVVARVELARIADDGQTRRLRAVCAEGFNRPVPQWPGQPADAVTAGGGGDGGSHEQ